MSRNRPGCTGFYKGTMVSFFLVLDVKKVRFVEVEDTRVYVIFISSDFRYVQLDIRSNWNKSHYFEELLSF